jgi:mono/diheme cytochrome c family protein
MSRKVVIGIAMILAVAALVPLGLIAVSRSRPSPALPVHPVLDMDKQPKFKGQRGNPMFADGRSLRPTVPGTLAREDLALAGGSAADYDRVVLGVEKQADGTMGFVTQIPVPVDVDLMRRGQERFDIYCATCHGLSGYGDGMVARRANELRDIKAENVANWVAPTSYHTKDLRDRAVGSLYNTIANGKGNMPAYGSQIPVLDRWAIVAYERALQRSQDARPGDVPEAERDKFKK